MPEDIDLEDMALYRASLESEAPAEAADAETNYDGADFGGTPESSVGSPVVEASAVDNLHDSDDQGTGP